MKERYTEAGIAVARYHLVDNYDACKAFIEEVGYPVIVKPDRQGMLPGIRLDDEADVLVGRAPV